MLVAGNWKMNGSKAKLAELSTGIARLMQQSPPRACEVLVLPPYIYMPGVMDCLEGSVVKVGAQDLDARETGAVTGAVSGAMLKDLGCSHVLVGHSERRQLFGEDDSQVAEKFARALAEGLTPILCVGESDADRLAMRHLEVVRRQLMAVNSRVGVAGLANGHIAYEPVWAIGTGKSASPELAEEVHDEIRHYLDGLDATATARVKVLYGGSVSPENAASLLEQAHIDGALVGGASLDAESFVNICRAADSLQDG